MRKDDSPCVRQAPEVEPVSSAFDFFLFFQKRSKQARFAQLHNSLLIRQGMNTGLSKPQTTQFRSRKANLFFAPVTARSSERLPNRRTALFRGAVRPGNFGWGRDVSEMIDLEKWDVIMYTCWRLTIWTIWTSKMTTPHNKTQHGRSKRLKPKIPHRTVRNYLETQENTNTQQSLQWVEQRVELWHFLFVVQMQSRTTHNSPSMIWGAATDAPTIFTFSDVYEKLPHSSQRLNNDPYDLDNTLKHVKTRPFQQKTSSEFVSRIAYSNPPAKHASTIPVR